MKVAGLLVAPQNERPRNVAAALRMVHGEPEPTDDYAGYRKLMGAWRGADASERSRFLDFLVAEKAVARIKGGKARANYRARFCARYLTCWRR